MFIEDLPEALIETVKRKIEEDQKNQDKRKPEEIVVNPTIDSPYSVRNQ